VCMRVCVCECVRVFVCLFVCVFVHTRAQASAGWYTAKARMNLNKLQVAGIVAVSLSFKAFHIRRKHGFENESRCSIMGRVLCRRWLHLAYAAAGSILVPAHGLLIPATKVTLHCSPLQANAARYARAGASHVEGRKEQDTQQQVAAAACFYKRVVKEIVAASESEHDGAVRLLHVSRGKLCERSVH
jgi:hypothetical protein